jgi:hypothetical protein
MEEQQAAVAQNIARLKRDYLPSITGGGGTTGRARTSVAGQLEHRRQRQPLDLQRRPDDRADRRGGATLAELEFNTQALRRDIASRAPHGARSAPRRREHRRLREGRAAGAREPDLADGRYSTGVGNIIEVTTRRPRLTSAEASYVQSSTATRPRSPRSTRHGPAVEGLND